MVFEVGEDPIAKEIVRYKQWLDDAIKRWRRKIDIDFENYRRKHDDLG